MTTDRELESQTKAYLDGIAAQTRGSYRVKRANTQGMTLVRLLNLMPGTQAEKSIIGYVERAQLRLSAANGHRLGLDREKRILIASLLQEREAFKLLLELDQMESLSAIRRVNRCARCEVWFWGRVASQRYCSTVCRMRHYQGSQEGKRYKREWAREAYHRNKKRDDAIRQLATGKKVPRFQRLRGD